MAFFSQYNLFLLVAAGTLIILEPLLSDWAFTSAIILVSLWGVYLMNKGWNGE